MGNTLCSAFICSAWADLFTSAMHKREIDYIANSCKEDGSFASADVQEKGRYPFRLLREHLLVGITCSNEGAGHSPSMARDAAPAASVPQVVEPDASFELRDAEASVTLAVIECCIGLSPVICPEAKESVPHIANTAV
jgi:hypothetical protein